MTATSLPAPPQRWHLPRGVARARLAMGIVAALLSAHTAIVVVGYVGAALNGFTLVFSQDEMHRLAALGPAPMAGESSIGPAPMEGVDGSDGERLPASGVGVNAQYVDVGGMLLVATGAAVAAVGVVWLPRRSRWSVPAGLAGMAVVVGVAALPGLLGLWAMDFYRLGVGDVAVFFVATAGLGSMAALAVAAIWRHRAALGPVSA